MEKGKRKCRVTYSPSQHQTLRTNQRDVVVVQLNSVLEDFAQAFEVHLILKEHTFGFEK